MARSRPHWKCTLVRRSKSNTPLQWSMLCCACGSSSSSMFKAYSIGIVLQVQIKFSRKHPWTFAPLDVCAHLISLYCFKSLGCTSLAPSPSNGRYFVFLRLNSIHRDLPFCLVDRSCSSAEYWRSVTFFSSIGFSSRASLGIQVISDL